MKTRIIATTLLGLCASSVVAQEEATDTTLHVNEVIISSFRHQPSAVSKLPVPLEKAPITVSSVERPKIEMLGLRDLND